MNKNQLQGNWNQLQGKIREQWGKLTDDDVALYKGKRDQFLGKIQETYGIAREEAERNLKSFETACGYGAANDRAA